AIPVSKSQVFTTAANNQPQVEIKVLQGERSMAADNVKLGEFVLDGIPPAPRGVPQIEVTFNIDVNGILNVSAKDKGTGKAQKITIQSSNLSKDEIERMKNDAEAHAEEDEQKRSAAEVRNEADAAVFAAEKLMNDLGDKMSAEEKGKVNSRLDALKSAIEKNDGAAMKRAKEDLDKTLQEFSTRLYQAAGAGAAGSPTGDAGASSNNTGSGGPSDGETVDAEFSERQ
ncbi:MAG: Hsp70 family protein, partial [Fretibacterium sp.]|nr:Hsp70 family protein [Fretibacterium sp.]